ncbi:transcription factor cwo isoform X2 [Agrilus planipennis]|uniref:Transcription factor cwo isoform X2 n=1 Tax=Agrilus planipennis TaxID=224129 RepID=A0A1W4X4G8_AGRPL|nr:transcription factor cwo isoform X2 [Agrilus planipennis]
MLGKCRHKSYRNSSANSKEDHHHLQLKDEGPANVYSCYNGNLNFSTAVCSEDDSEYGGPYKKNKASRQDPLSHRIIEKRRRDRMNNCLADLSRLIPAEYLKKGRGRIEKTEIIEMAIKHMKYLQQLHTTPSEHYRLGYQECMSEAMRFLVEVEGHFPREGICVRLLSHLQKHCDTLSRVPPSPIKVRTPPDLGIPRSDISGREEPPPTSDSNKTSSDESPPQTKCNGHHNVNTTEMDTSNVRNGHLSEPEVYDKHSENSNGAVSYKYKTDIKQRFNQEFNGVTFKRQRRDSDDMRRSSLASLESQSLSRSSPPSSEVSARISSANLKSENNSSASYQPRNERHLSPYHPLSVTESPIHHYNGRGNADLKNNFNVPVFVLNAKGSFYVPITVDYLTLLPFLQNYNLLDGFANLSNIVLHPVTINVNFQPNGMLKYKSEFLHNGWH